jgi:hypothetical protein
MYLGSRFHGQALHDPELFRAAGKYAGVVSVNVYGIWQLDSETTATWERESGKPFIVTEFYAKGEDSDIRITPAQAGSFIPRMTAASFTRTLSWLCSPPALASDGTGSSIRTTIPMILGF